MELKDIKGPDKDFNDPRFKDPEFKEAVKTVLNHLGYEQPKQGDFRDLNAKFDGRIDWLEWADRIERPRFTAKCVVINHNSDGFCLDLFGPTREEALKNIPRGYEFKEWF